MPALGTSRFCLLEAPGQPAPHALAEQPSAGECVALENEHLVLDFCNGTLSKLTDKATGVTTPAVQSWLWYNASVGNKQSGQASGAYVFRPNSSTVLPVSAEEPVLRVLRGSLADEVHQTFGPWVSQRVRLAKGARHAELTYTVGEIPIQDGLGKEVISRFSTDLQNGGECFSDSNGREMLQRKKDFRATWSLNQTEEVAGNYYPVTTSLFIRDEKAQLTLLTDTS